MLLNAYPSIEGRRMMIELPDEDRMSPFQYAALRDDTNAVEIFLSEYSGDDDKRSLFELCNRCKRNVFQYAAQKGAWGTVIMGLSFYPDERAKQTVVELRDKRKKNLLHYAATGQQWEVLEQLLSYYTSPGDYERAIEIGDEEHRNTLQYTAGYGCWDMFEKMLNRYMTNEDKRRVIELCDKYKRNVIHYAVSQGAWAILNRFFSLYPATESKMAVCNAICDRKDRNILHCAAQAGKLLDALRILKIHKLKLDLSVRDHYGNTALHYIVMLRKPRELAGIISETPLSRSQLDQLFRLTNNYDLSPLDMAYITTKHIWRYRTDTYSSFLPRRGNDEMLTVTIKVANLMMSSYFVPRYISGVTMHCAVGSALIISNSFSSKSQVFHGTNSSPILGWQKEQCCVVEAMRKLNVEVRISNDLTGEEMIQRVGEFASQAKGPITFIFLMTHGGDSTFVAGNDGTMVSLQRLLEAADTENLKGQPKLIFVQACRGDIKSTKLSCMYLLCQWLNCDGSPTETLDSPPSELTNNTRSNVEPSHDLVFGAESLLNTQPYMEHPIQGEATSLLGGSNGDGLEAHVRDTAVGVTLPGKDFLLCMSTLWNEMAMRGVFMRHLSDCLVEMADGRASIFDVLTEVNLRLGEDAHGQGLDYSSTLTKHLRFNK